MEGSILGLVLGAWLCVVVAIGGQATAADVQTGSPSREIAPVYWDECRAPTAPSADEGAVCGGKYHPPVGTSRKPGAGLTERSPGANS